MSSRCTSLATQEAEHNSSSERISRATEAPMHLVNKAMNYVYQPTHTSTLHTHEHTYTCKHTHFYITHTRTHVHMQAHTLLHYTHTEAYTHAHTQDGASLRMFRIIAFFPQHHTVIPECFKLHTVAEGKPTCTQPWTSVTCSLSGAHV